MVERIGVVGAGTMGAGIAQLACLGGYRDTPPRPRLGSAGLGPARLRSALEKGTERGRWSAAEAEAAAERLEPVPEPAGLAGCELVIEAAPEEVSPEARAVRAARGDLRPGDHPRHQHLIALGDRDRRRGARARASGRHALLQPPALMRLVEVVAGEESAEEALEQTAEVARRMGRTPVRAADQIGFIGNRCARPYSLEGLRLLGARVAGHEQIDRICRLGGGFRMGPFELTDLVGIDVNLDVATSFWEQSFHEPRWQPHPIQTRMVASGRLGRKAGRGYYDYSAPTPPSRGPATARGGGERRPRPRRRDDRGLRLPGAAPRARQPQRPRAGRRRRRLPGAPRASTRRSWSS